MAASHSFSEEFYYAEGESESNTPTLNSMGQPVSLYGAILLMTDEQFAEACEANEINPDVSSAAAELVEAAKKHDTVDGYTVPVSVYLDADGYISIDVYDTDRD